MKSENSGGGLIFRPRPMEIATDITISDPARVAMIGGMLSTRIREKLKTPTSAPTRTAARMPGTISALLPSITSIATAPDSAIDDGMERSALPGPTLITSIWPKETKTVKAEKVSATVSSSPDPCPCPLNTVAAQANTAARHEPSHGRPARQRCHFAKWDKVGDGVFTRYAPDGRSQRADQAPR